MKLTSLSADRLLAKVGERVAGEFRGSAETGCAFSAVALLVPAVKLMLF